MKATFECPICHLEQEVDPDILDTSLDYDEEYEVPCEDEDCPAKFDLEWLDGYVYIKRAYLTIEFQCPKCEEELESEIEKKGGCASVTCKECRTEVQVIWSDWEFDEAEILRTTIEFYCPRDGTRLRLSNVAEEDSSKEITCEGCGAKLSATWWDWEIEEVSIA